MTRLLHLWMDELIWTINQHSRLVFSINRGCNLLCLMLLSSPVYAFAAPQNTQTSMHSVEVQAALIKNFTHLIEWPKNQHTGSTFNLCIYRSKALKQQFKTIFADKLVKGKQVNILNISSTDLTPCNLIYITPSPKALISHVLKSAHELGVLTISAQNGYGQQGIHINFYESGQNIAFELNKHALDSAGFLVSTQLYRYARIVR